MPRHSSPVDVITDELGALAVRGISRAFEPLGIMGPIDIARLSEVTRQHYPDLWNEDPGKAIELMVRNGIAQLDGKLGEADKKTAALQLFDLGDSIGEQSKAGRLVFDNAEKKYSFLLGQIAMKTKLAKGPSLRRKLRNLRFELASIVANSGVTLVGRAATQNLAVAGGIPKYGISSKGEAPYLKREEYHHAFDKALEDGCKVVVFVGPPGVGKTRLTREIVLERRQRVGATLEEFECASDKAFSAAIALQLGNCGILTDNLSEDQLRRAFIRRLHQDNAPAMTVLYQLHDDDLLESISIQKLRSTLVIVTTNIPTIGNKVARIPVRPFSVGDSVILARNWFPDKGKSELKLLVETVGFSPQMLEAVAHFLGHPRNELDISEFCRFFPLNASLILRNTASDLLGRYQAALDHLGASYPDSTSLLEHLVFLADLVPVDLLVECFIKKNEYTKDELSIMREVVRCALEILDDHALVTLDEICVRMNGLARAIMRQLVAPNVGEEVIGTLRHVIAERMSDAIGRQCDKILLPEDLMELTGNLVSHLFRIESDSSRGDVKVSGQAVASILQEKWNRFGYGSLVQVIPIDSDDELQFHQMTFQLDLSSHGRIVRRQLDEIALLEEDQLRVIDSKA